MASNTTLEFSIDGRVLFRSTGKWLHPLFDLERFLRDRRVDPRGGEIRDKIVGRGSAFLIVRMGIRNVHAGLLSRLGKDVLDTAGASCSWESLIDRIQCRTEGLLRDVTDAEQAHRILADLAEADSRPAESPGQPVASPSPPPGTAAS
ncbi:MAG: DUF1893 domain-containing protein [Spirochaetia bacterium]|jgi:zinc transport system ATP-binding protein